MLNNSSMYLALGCTISPVSAFHSIDISSNSDERSFSCSSSRPPEKIFQPNSCSSNSDPWITVWMYFK